ncbi:MAG: 2Fe-2S iron-sulfur cluster-binding protein [Pseudobdellovibrio sp.]
MEFSRGDNLLDTLNANKVSISQSCDGNGSCTTCLVYILKGLESCSPRTEIEMERALERNFAANERLACQTCMNEDVEIEIQKSIDRDPK